MSKIPAISTHYAGQKFRSRTEARWAVFFDTAGIRYQYEFEGHVIRSGAYLPDFWLPELRLYFEVKGADPTEEERRKCAELCEAAECDVLLAVGQPDELFQIHWFDRGGERDDRYALARDRITECGFWLVAEDHANWIGPDRTKGEQRPAGPMFSGALEHCYAAARSEQFPRMDRPQRHRPITEYDPDRLWLAWLPQARSEA